MKKLFLVFASTLAAGMIFFIGNESVSAEELSTDEIITNVTTVGGVTIEEIIVPNEINEEWEKENGWVDSHSVEEMTSELMTSNPFQSATPKPEITTYGASAPLFTYWDVKNGSYSFSGSFKANNALYTNKAIKGATQYKATITNTGSTKVGFEARDRLKVYKSSTLLVSATTHLKVNMSSASNSFYLKFYPINGAGSVKGTIRKN